MRFNYLTLTLALLVITGLVGCGGSSTSSGGGGGGNPTLSSITVAGPASLDLTKTGQFSATGHFSDNSAKDLTSTVTWASSSSSSASVSSSGLATALAAGNTKISATSGSVNGSAALKVNGPVSITLTPIGPAVSKGGPPQQLKATGNFSDGPLDLTSIVSWSSSASIVASVSNTGMVTGAAAGVTTITATAGKIIGSTAVNVTSQTFSAASLNGSYAFFLTSVDSRGQAALVGSLTADGNGNVTAGIVDFNNASGVSSKGPVSLIATKCKYNVWPDGRGEATITFNTQAVHVAFILSDVVSKVATKGKMISFDSNKAFGNFERQTGGAALSGVYVFAFNGLDPTHNSEAQIGVFDTAKLTENFDVDDNGTVDGSNKPLPKTPLKFSSVMTSAVSTGNRGTAQLGTAALGAANYAFYTVDGTKAYFIETDAVAGSTALAGVAELQAVPTPVPLSPEVSPSPCATGGSEPTCNYAYLLDHAASAQNGVFEKAGQFNFCPCTVQGGINHAHEENDLDGQTWSVVSGTRPFDGLGRGRIQYKVTNSGNPTGVQRYAIGYTINSTAGVDVPSSSARFFMMNTEVVTAPASPGVGAVDFINNDPANTAPVAGTYAFSLAAIGDANLLQLGQVTLAGASNATGITYINNSGALSAVAVGGVLTMDTGAADGRGTLKPFNGTTSSLTTYSVGGKGLILLGTNPDISGRMEVQ